jgi:hypothetical protein
VALGALDCEAISAAPIQAVVQEALEYIQTLEGIAARTGTVAAVDAVVDVRCWDEAVEGCNLPRHSTAVVDAVDAVAVGGSVRTAEAARPFLPQSFRCAAAPKISIFTHIKITNN